MTTAETDHTQRAKSGAKPPSALFYVLLAGALLIFIQTFAVLSPILLSLLLILLISLAVNPVIVRLRAWTGGRKSAVGLLTLVVVGILGLTGWAFIVPMKDSVTKLAEQFPVYWERFQKPLIKLDQQAVNSEKRLQAEVATDIALEKVADGFDAGPATASAVRPKAEPPRQLASVRSRLSQMFQGAVGSFSAMALNAGQVLIVLVTVFFGVFYTLMNPRPIFGVLFSLVPERYHTQTLTIMQRMGDFIPRWAGATLLGMLTIGLLTFLLMWPFFGFMDALVLGLIAGVLEAIPYLGPMLSAIPALLLAFGEGGLTPLWVVFAFATVQALENNVIIPLIMTRGLHLHPLAVILSMLLCVAAFGVLGVLVAAPVAAMVCILHDELYRKRFLPTVTDADLEWLSRKALHE